MSHETISWYLSGHQITYFSSLLACFVPSKSTILTLAYVLFQTDVSAFITSILLKKIHFWQDCFCRQSCVKIKEEDSLNLAFSRMVRSVFPIFTECLCLDVSTAICRSSLCSPQMNFGSGINPDMKYLRSYPSE